MIDFMGLKIHVLLVVVFVYCFLYFSHQSFNNFNIPQWWLCVLFHELPHLSQVLQWMEIWFQLMFSIHYHFYASCVCGWQHFGVLWWSPTSNGILGLNNICVEVCILCWFCYRFFVGQFLLGITPLRFVCGGYSVCFLILGSCMATVNTFHMAQPFGFALLQPFEAYLIQEYLSSAFGLWPMSGMHWVVSLFFKWGMSPSTCTVVPQCIFHAVGLTAWGLNRESLDHSSFHTLSGPSFAL